MLIAERPLGDPGKGHPGFSSRLDATCSAERYRQRQALISLALSLITTPSDFPRPQQVTSQQLLSCLQCRVIAEATWADIS